jgi:monoterpene epsilon-lactone hydrolase
MSSLISKVIKFGFKVKGVKNNFSTNNPDISKMRRRNLGFSELEAKRYKFQLNEVNERQCFIRKNDSKTIVIWLHGGAYSLGPFKWHLMRLGQICNELGVDGALPDYPKAPEFNHKQNLEYLIDFYKDVISQYDNFYLLGDSAGGGLALGFSLLLKDKGFKTPKAIYTFSPWLDLSSSVDSTAYDKYDPFLSQQGLDTFAKLYGGDELTSPYVSPFYDDFSKLDSKIYIYSGTHDILHAAVVEFFKKNKNVEQRIYDEMIHAWALMPIPEGKQVMNEVISTIKENLSVPSEVSLKA